MGCGMAKRKEETPQVVSPQTKDPTELPQESPEDERVQFDEDLHKEVLLALVKGRPLTLTKNPQENEKVGFFELEATPEGDQMLAIKPWLGALKEPSNSKPFKNSPPNINLELQYVYGYRCFDSRQNLFYTRNSNEIVYMTAALGVVLNKTNNTQKIHGGGPAQTQQFHNDDIKALAIHPDKEIVATGEVGKNPKICIWSTADPSRSIVEFKQGNNSRAVTCLGFSSDGEFLSSADLSNDHCVHVWNWRKATKVTQDKGGPDKILDLCWSPVETLFCTVGIKHIYFWEHQNNAFKKAKGIFGSAGAICNMTCVQWLSDGSCVTGATNGQLYHWSGRQLRSTYQVHSKGASIHSLCISGNTVVSGGKDNTVRVLDSAFSEKQVINLSSFPRALDVFGDNILVGTRDGTIAEYTQNSKKVLMESHCDGEVWGLSVASDPNMFITTGDDNYIRVWNMQERRCVNKALLEEIAGPSRRLGASTFASTSPNQQARAVAVNPHSLHVAVGHCDGHVSIYSSYETLEKIKTCKEPKEWIESMAYSPDGAKLAVGSHDNFIYIYLSTSYKLLHKLKGHSSFIIALDWSTDSSSLHSNCGAYELLYWDAQTGEQVPGGASRFRDENWATWTAKFGWPVQGIFEGIVDMTHINAVDRSQNQKFFGVGNDFGDLVLFNNPNGEGAQGKSYKGHSEHITNVKWSSEDEYILTTGGYDQTIMQWHVNKYSI